MKQFCKHQKYKVIDWIKDPKWSTNEILISVDAIDPNTEHYLFRFANESPKKKYGWFYLEGKVIRRFHTQKNGGGMVYVVPLDRREDFTPLIKCEHGD